jgi:SAM-dependent methyltransferase
LRTSRFAIRAVEWNRRIFWLPNGDSTSGRAYRESGAAAPWDIGRPQAAILRLLDENTIEGPALDAGCGGGEHALALASRGIEATGVAFSRVAIDLARAKARARGVDVRFEVGDVSDPVWLTGTFRTVIDTGTFHTFATPDDVRRYVATLTAAVDPGGIVHLLCFSDREPGDGGPRRVTRDELRQAFGGTDRMVESIEPATFEVNRPIGDAGAWLAKIIRVG